MTNLVSKNSISVLIRVVNEISKPSEYLLPKIIDYCGEIILIFSGTEEKYLEISRRYQQFEKIKIFWVYSIGYSEPIVNLMMEKISGEWVLNLLDRSLPSSSLIESLPRLVNSKADAYCIYRYMGKYENRDIPKWLLYFIQDGRRKTFQCNLSRKEVTRYSEIIHGGYKIKGRKVKLNPVIYNIERSYNLGDLNDINSFINHWVEKESRYILIEMFQTRMSRKDVISLFLNKMRLSDNHKLIFKGKSLLSKELSFYEYSLYALIGNFFNGKLGLSLYDRVKVNTIRDLKKYKKFLFDISQYLRSLEEREVKILEFIGMTSVLVCKKDQNFGDLIRPENSELYFIRHVLKKFIQLDDRYKDIDIDDVTYEIQTILNDNVSRFAPIKKKTYHRGNRRLKL